MAMTQVVCGLSKIGSCVISCKACRAWQKLRALGVFRSSIKSTSIPTDCAAYGVTLGELYSAVARSNSAVGGRVLQKGGSEYLIRSVGWIQSLADVEKIVVKSVNGTPIYVSNIASVQFGSAARRTSLEKNGNEVVGGVVLMRYGENPLEITERIKNKIVQLQAGLPEGVRIVPFYDRTRLIEAAIGTVSHTVLEEMLVASAAVILVMWHFRGALIICLTLPMAVLFSFILMRWLNIPSNIMSLSGIAISIGVLVDASIVMVDQGVHTLYERFGNSRINGDTCDLLQPALQTVGRPIFFAMLIMVLGFVPVFCAFRHGRPDVSPTGLHEDVCLGWHLDSGHHFGPGADSEADSRPSAA